MNLKHDIKACLDTHGWNPHRLAKEAGLKSDMAIRRVLSGERQGMHSKNLLKLAPFLYPPTTSPGQDVHLPACELAASPAPGENFPKDAVYLRDKFSVPLLQDDRLVIPSNVVKKLYEKRVVKDGMTADQVSDMLWSIFHSNKSKALPSKHDHIQTLVNAREELSRIGFISEGLGGRPVVKSGHMVATDRIEKTALGGRAVPPSSAQVNPDVPRQAARFSDVQGGPSQKEIIPPGSDGKGDVSFSRSDFQEKYLSDWKQRPLMERLKETDLGRAGSTVQMLFTDKTAPSRRLAEMAGGKPQAEAFDRQARRRAGSHGIVMDMIDPNGAGVSRYGEAGHETEIIPGSKTLGKILDPLKGNAEAARDFESFMVATRMVALSERNESKFQRIKGAAKELEGVTKDIALTSDPGERRQLEKLRDSLSTEKAELKKGMVTGLNPEMARTEIERIRDRYGEAKVEQFREMHKDLIQWADDAVLKPRVDAGLMSREVYKNIKEDMAHDSWMSFQREMEGDGGGVGGPGGPKRIKGSERKIVSPLTSLEASLQRNVHEVEQAKTIEALVSLRDVSPEMAEIIKPMGKGPFTPSRFKGVTTWRDGVAQHWQVPPEVAIGINGMSPQAMRLFRVATAPLRVSAQFLRVGATVLSTSFTLRNIIRDNIAASSLSEHSNAFRQPGLFLKGIVEHFKDAMGKGSDIVSEWRRAGGETGVYTALERSALELSVQDLLNIRERTTTGKIAHWAATPWRAIKILNEAGEKATRIGLYENARRSGASPASAMLESRDTTVDFARSGLAGELINQIIPFWNANVQGVAKMGRTLDKPSFWLNVALGVTLPSVMEWMAYKDDPEWRELADWERDFFWHIKMPSGDFIRIPKPFEIGSIYGSAVQRTLDQLSGYDDKGMTKAGKAIVQSLTPPVSSPLITPFVEGATNHSFFSGRPLESKSMENLPPWMRFNTSTTELSKVSSKASSDIARVTGMKFIEVSPQKIDNWIRGQFGTAGMDAAKSMDNVISSRAPAPDRKWYESTPLVSAFVSKEPIGSRSDSVNTFYDNLEKTGQAASGSKALSEAGNTADLGRFDKKDIFFAASYRKFNESMTESRQDIAAIQQDMAMTPEEKRTRIDDIERKMTARAREVNTAYRNNSPTPEMNFLGIKAQVNELYDKASGMIESGQRGEAVRMLREDNLEKLHALVQSISSGLRQIESGRQQLDKNQNVSPEKRARFEASFDQKEGQLYDKFNTMSRRIGGRLVEERK